MRRIIVESLVTSIFLVWLVVTVTFFALRIYPLDAISAQLSGSGQPESVVLALRASLSLDQPPIIQYWRYLQQLMRFDLGNSLYGGQTVSEILAQNGIQTFSLALLALMMAVPFGFVVGICASLDRWFSTVAWLLLDVSIAMPIFWTATLAIFTISSMIGGIQNNIWIPASVLAFHSGGAIGRIVQTSIQEIRVEPYMLTAHAKGLSNRYLFRQILLPMSFPILTTIAIQASILFSGTIITETIFGRAGLGQLLVNAVLERNYPVVQGGVILVTISYIMIQSTSEIIATTLDPRLRHVA